MQSKSPASSKTFLTSETKEDFQWLIKNSKPSFTAPRRRGFYGRILPKISSGEDFFHGMKIICEVLFEDTQRFTLCAVPSYQERFSAVTRKNGTKHLIPNWDWSLKESCEEKSKVCDLREPCWGPNIELSEARSHQPALGCPNLAQSKTLLKITGDSCLHTQEGNSFWIQTEKYSCTPGRTCSHKSASALPLSHICENFDLVVVVRIAFF